jgi:hypothetical protein
MKETLIPVLAVCFALTLLAGCSRQVGGGSKHVTIEQTTGQQLIDLQKAKDARIITDTEFQVQKAKILGGK